MHSSHFEDDPLPSSPYMNLPSSSPSRPTDGYASIGLNGTHTIYYTTTAESMMQPNSSTGALIQADLFCSSSRSLGKSGPMNLLRFRFFSAVWLLVCNIFLPVCEYQGDTCAFGITRYTADGERGTLSGEGQPNPDPGVHPDTPYQRTLWFIASLSYIFSCGLFLYFLYSIFLAYSYRFLFKQCTSYPYDNLSIVSHSSSSGRPLVFSQKVAAIMFQLIIPSTIGVNKQYQLHTERLWMRH